MDKSAITFSPNVAAHDKASIFRIVGLTNVASHDKNLGLPTVVGLNKRRTFEGIKEWV